MERRDILRIPDLFGNYQRRGYDDMSREAMILYWIEKAEQDIASANDNYTAERRFNAVREAYSACFHAFSALLLPEWGKNYDWLFSNRQKTDYRPFVQFETEQVREIIEKSEAFVYMLKNKAINNKCLRISTNREAREESHPPTTVTKTVIGIKKGTVTTRHSPLLFAG